MNEELQYSETGSLLDELKAAAFEYLLLNPGSEFGDWKQGLISDYPTEVVDALGNNPEEVYADLADLWESDYADPKTGIEQKYSEWAMSFANEYAVGIYYFLVEECAKSGDVPLSSANRQVTHNKPIDCAAQAERKSMKKEIEELRVKNEEITAELSRTKDKMIDLLIERGK